MGIQDISRELGARITFPSLLLDDFYIQDFEYSGSLLTKDEFEIGTAPAMRLKVKLIDTTGLLKGYDFKNRECNVEIGISGIVDDDITYDNLENYTYEELEGRTYDDMIAYGLSYHSIGLFTVEKATRLNETITLECIDRMYRAEVPYIDNLTYPATVMQVLQSACARAELELITTTFANADYIIPNKPVYTNVSVRQILANAAELAGGYAVINKLGQIEILTLDRTGLPVTEINTSNYITLKFDEVAPAMIDQVIVKVGDQQSTKGIGIHPYTIVNNIFVQNPELVSQAIYDVLFGLNYSPLNLKWQGNWTLDLGDKLMIDDDENIRFSYLFDRKLTYKGGVREDIKAANKSDIIKNSTGKGSTTLQIENVKTDIKIVDGKIEQLITDTDGKISTINQEIGNINLAVADKASTAEINILAESIESKVTQEQVQDLIDEVNRANPNLVTNYSENWEQGEINSTDGIISDSVNHIRTKAYFPIRQGHVYIKVSPLYQAMIILYDSNYSFKASYGFSTEQTFLLDANCYFKVVLRRTNLTAIEPSAIDTAELKVENSDVATQYTPYYGDLTLEQQQEYFVLEVASNNGWTIDNDSFTATFTAKIYLFNDDVTSRFQPLQFTWYKQYPGGQLISLGNGTSKVITGASIEKSATISCAFEIYDTIYTLTTFNNDTLLTVANDEIMAIGYL